MAEVVRMPKMSDTMTEGVIVNWHKKVGDTIKAGDLLAEIETDKAVMEFESFQSGKLLYIGAEKGATIQVDEVIAVLGKEGEDYKSLLKTPVAAEKKQEPKPEIPAANSKTTPVESSQLVSESEKKTGRTKASPLAKRIAGEAGLPLTSIKGSGDDGRIIRRDVEAYLKTGGTSKPSFQVISGEEGYDEVPLSQMRKTIARRLAESKFSAPHFYLTMDINMDLAISAREQLNAVYPDQKISFNDMIIKATALSLRRHGKVNSSWLGEKIRYNHHVHIGMAVAVDDGLLVPVIRFADQKTFSQINAESKILAQKAREKKLQPEEMQGNTFTISNLGMMDIDEFTAIINPPDACILAVGKIRREAIVMNDQIRIGNRMKVTLSCDHRAVDGATGAAFLQTVKQYLENPVAMLTGN
jgi:pyruvate dehydrogenase E2 component (dihydrolipoamide acetyltransferase)